MGYLLRDRRLRLYLRRLAIMLFSLVARLALRPKQRALLGCEM